MTSNAARRPGWELQLVLDNVETGVVAVNLDGSVRFANDAAAQAFGLQSADELKETGLDAAISQFDLYDEQGRPLAGRAELTSRVFEGDSERPIRVLVVPRGDHQPRWYQFRATTVEDEGVALAWVLLTFDDVTQLKEHEGSLRRSEEAYRRIGEVVQRGIMPPAIPEIPEIDLAVTFRALGDRTMIGGDFYDVFSLAGDQWMLVVGDIAGKGVEAAAFTALVRYTIRATAVREHDPTTVLRRLNEILIEDPAQPRLCTAMCALVEPGEKTLVTFARGGHCPALLLPRDAEQAARIEPGGPILGAFADASFAAQTVEFDRDDTLVLYTDGVTDAGSRDGNGAALGLDGVEAELRRNRDRDAGQIAAAIDSAAAAADDGRQIDDALVVVARGR